VDDKISTERCQGSVMLAFILGLTQAHSHDLSGGVDLSDFSSGGPLGPARTIFLLHEASKSSAKFFSHGLHNCCKPQKRRSLVHQETVLGYIFLHTGPRLQVLARSLDRSHPSTSMFGKSVARPPQDLPKMYLITL